MADYSKILAYCDEYNHYLQAIKKIHDTLDNMSEAQRNALQKYYELGNGNVHLSLESVKASGIPAILVQGGFYISMSSEQCYVQILAMDKFICEEVGFPVPELYYKVVFGDCQISPTFVFDQPLSQPTKDMMKQYFNRDMHSYSSQSRYIYVISGLYPADECISLIESAIVVCRLSPCIGEMIKIGTCSDVNYCLLPVVREIKPTYLPHKLAPKDNSKYVSVDDITKWVDENPPKTMTREQYYQACCAELGQVKAPMFSQVVQRRYKSRRTHHGRYWDPI